MVILDDILSGLDAATEEEIFASILGPTGLLRRLGTTVILATHAGMSLRSSCIIVANEHSPSSLRSGLYYCFG